MASRDGSAPRVARSRRPLGATGTATRPISHTSSEPHSSESRRRNKEEEEEEEEEEQEQEQEVEQKEEEEEEEEQQEEEQEVEEENEAVRARTGSTALRALMRSHSAIVIVCVARRRIELTSTHDLAESPRSACAHRHYYPPPDRATTRTGYARRSV